MAIPGTKAVNIPPTDSTHNERGSPSSQADDHIAQMDKRRAQDRGVRLWRPSGPRSRARAKWRSSPGGRSTAPIREAIAATRARRRLKIKLDRPALDRAGAAGEAARTLDRRQTPDRHRTKPFGPILALSARALRIAGRRGSDSSLRPLPFRPNEIGRGASRAGNAMNITANEARVFKPADYKSDVKPVWCPGCGDHSVLMALQRAMAELALAAEGHRGGFRNRLLLASCRPIPIAMASMACTAARSPPHRSQSSAARSDRDRRQRRRRRLFHRRQSFPARLPAQYRSDLYRHGQSHLRHDQGPAFADDGAGLGHGDSSGGTGLSPFHPLVIALASGANFIARGFSGDIGGCARLMVEAIRTPGFSFLQILSPCVTFRPDQQRGWKDLVHTAIVPETDDPGRAARRLMTDDGFNIGVLYRGKRPPYQPRPLATLPAAHLEAEFLDECAERSGRAI